MNKSYGDFVAKDTPTLARPAVDEKVIYDNWINGGWKKFPAYMDYYENVTGRNVRHY